MTDSNRGHDRRTVLKTIGGVAGGFGMAVASTREARAMKGEVHRKWAKQAAQQVADNNAGPPDYLVDDIASAAPEPDDGNYENCCGLGSFFDEIQQGYTHYRNPHGYGDYDETGDAHKYAQKRAVTARNYRKDGYEYSAAEYTGRALHYIQDIGTVVHTGMEDEQEADRDIHHDYERWVKNNWDAKFAEAADYGGYDTINGKDDISWHANEVSKDSHDRLHDIWWDLEDKAPYDDNTVSKTQAQVEDATQLMQGVIDWIWNS